jgi:hypothetical protein
VLEVSDTLIRFTVGVSGTIDNDYGSHIMCYLHIVTFYTVDMS